MRLVDVRKPRVMLGVDSKWRDLLPYTYLKLLLEEKYGMEVVLVRRTWERFYLSLVRPDIVIFEGFYYDKWAELARELHRMGVKIVILPTEGAPTDQPSKDRLAGKPYDFSVIDLFLSWNEEIRDMLLQFGALPPERIKVTGPPRMDFYRAPLNGLVEDRARFLEGYGLPADRPTITFATNFAFAGVVDERPEVLAHERRVLAAPDGSLNPLEDPYVLAEGERRMRAALLDSLVRIRKDFPDCNILLRPHPAEGHRLYRDFLNRAGLRDIPLVYTKYIWDVINASDLLIVRCSTTTFDAWMAGRPTIEFQIDADTFSKTVGKEFEGGSAMVDSYEQMRRQIEEALSGKGLSAETQAARDRKLKAYFHQPDGRCSERACQALRELAETIPYSPDKDGAVTRRFMNQTPKAAMAELMGFMKGPFVRQILGTAQSVDYLGRYDRFIYPGDLRRSLRRMRGLRRVWAK
jgi:surface carbohydrate biosynthesis protein